MFIGMDIARQTQKLIDITLTNGTCKGMTIPERIAYEMGIQNTLSALVAVLNADDGEYVVHMSGKEDIEEYMVDEFN